MQEEDQSKGPFVQKFCIKVWYTCNSCSFSGRGEKLLLSCRKFCDLVNPYRALNKCLYFVLRIVSFIINLL